MSRAEALHFINVAHFFDHFFLLIFPTAALAIAPAWDMSFADVLLLGSPLYVMFALGTLPAGWLGDRMDRMILIAMFFLGCGGASLWIAVSSGPAAMMIGLGALGMFAAIYHPVGLAHVTQIGLRTGRALAINGVFGNMGLAGAAVTTGVIAQYLGWQAAFLLPGALSILIGGLLIWRSRAPMQVANDPNNGATTALPMHGQDTQRTVFLVVCISALFGGLIFNVVTISLPKFLDDRLISTEADLAWIGASAGAIFAVAAFAQLPVGELLDRIGARPIMLTLLSAQAMLLMFLMEASGWTALFLALLLVTSIFAEIPVTTWLLGHYLDPSLRSRAVSVEYVLSLGIGSAAVPLIAFLYGRGFGFDIQFAGLALSAGAIIASVLFLPRRISAVTN